MMIQEYRSSNKRIAKNTLVVYCQLLLRMFLGLYTSRLALEALGVSDFGLNSVVGGVVVLFTFISSSLSSTTVRFINVEKGKTDGDLNMVFNVCNLLHIAMAIFLFVLLEAGGTYYIYHYLNVDPGKEADAMFVFQVSTVMCCLGIINVPFASLFNATENFIFTAVVEISVKVVQLLLLYWLLTYEGSRIRAFALIETLTTMTSFVVYHYYAYRRWSEVVIWKFVRGWKIYKEVLAYSSYDLLQTLAVMGRGQGSLLLINYFFGTVVNGAFAVAKTVERNILPFANNFHGAAAPQITQSYSSGDMERVFYLTSRIGKYSMLMMVLAFFPLWAELDYILHLWLIKVPEGALVFCQMILLITFVSITHGGVVHVINASGKVACFRITYSILMLLCIPIGFMILKKGSPAYMLLVLYIIADIIYRIVQFYLMQTILNFPVLRFCRKVFLPVIYTCLPLILILLLTSQIQIETPLWHISHIIVMFMLAAISAYYLGLRKHEREKVLTYLIQRIKLL